MAEETTLPHKLSMHERKSLTLTGATQVVRFDEQTVVLETDLGRLSVHGTGLQLKNLSLEGGHVAIDGQIDALIYENQRAVGGLRRLFR